MKDLNEYGVHSLDARELKRVDGGLIFSLMVAFAVGYFVGDLLFGEK